MSEPWTDSWIEEQLLNFRPIYAPEWDICDECKSNTHIMVGKFIQKDNSLMLLCKKCQLSL